MQYSQLFSFLYNTLRFYFNLFLLEVENDTNENAVSCTQFTPAMSNVNLSESKIIDDSEESYFEIPGKKKVK